MKISASEIKNLRKLFQIYMLLHGVMLKKRNNLRCLLMN